ncbi:MAG: TonB-dependent receptor [Planctomycetes bacterium]|nr:TonB-dependent receptor [Planctomycetota bacterium]
MHTPTLPASFLALCASSGILAQAPTPQDPEPTRGQDVADTDDGQDRIVVTASGFREQALHTPYTFQTLDQTTMLERGSRTLPEALRYTPGVMIQKTAHGHGSPYIRGFTGRQNLLLIDGIRLNNSTFRGGPVQYWNTIDAFSIDRIEIIKSQGSVLYGSDAIGGTVNVMTRSSDFAGQESGEIFHHGSAFYRLDTNSISHTGNVEASVGRGGSWGLRVGLTYRDFGDIRDSEVGRMPKTGYDEFDYDLRFDSALSESTTFTFAHQRVRQDDIWRSHRTIYFEPWHGTSLGSPDLARTYDQDRMLTYARVRGEDLGGVIESYSATLSFQEADEDFVRKRTAGANIRDEVDRTEVDTLGFVLSMESELGAGTLVYGVDYYVDFVDSVGRDIRIDPNGTIVSNTMDAQGPVGDNARYDLFGAYAQYRMPVSDSVEVTVGGRYTYAEADIDTLDDGAGNPISAERHWDKGTFNVRANYRVTEELSVYGGASQAFRAPNLNDLSSLKSSRTDQISTGSLTVSPENYITYELGTRFAGPEVGFGAAVFYTDVSDSITSRPIGTVPGTGEIITASTNGSDGWLFGFETEASWRMTEELTATGTLAWVDGEADTFPTNSLTPVQEPVSRLMPLTGTVGLRWQPTDRPYWLGGRLIAAGHAGRLNSGDRGDTSRIPPDGTPGYLAVMVNGGYEVNEHFECFLTVDNVTDIDYRVHGSGVNEPGINAIIGGKLAR